MLAFEGKQVKKQLIGGGTKGSYHAGALDAFTTLLPPEEIAYDVIAGKRIST